MTDDVKSTNQIHRSCEDAYDGDVVGPYCEYCRDRLGEMDFYSMIR